nr:MAG TPA: hypothetical protein [Caudoviricetes sp.]
MRVGPCLFCFPVHDPAPVPVFILSSPFPSGLRALLRRPGHEPEWSESDTFPPTHTAAFAPQRV